MTLSEVKLWGRTIGAVSLEDGGGFAAFQYAPAFARSGIKVSPITIPPGDRVYVFSDLPQRTFYGLPGLLADSLPDRFGHALIDAWLATQGRTPESFNAVERLTEGTVKTHVKNLLNKLHGPGRTAAVREAVHRGLVHLA